MSEEGAWGEVYMRLYMYTNMPSYVTYICICADTYSPRALWWLLGLWGVPNGQVRAKG